MIIDFGEVIFELMKIDRLVCIDVIFKNWKKSIINKFLSFFIFVLRSFIYLLLKKLMVLKFNVSFFFLKIFCRWLEIILKVLFTFNSGGVVIVIYK